jgi:hypothetical protein
VHRFGLREAALALDEPPQIGLATVLATVSVSARPEDPAPLGRSTRYRPAC